MTAVERREADDRLLRGLGLAVALWSVAYLLPHAYWAAGGTLGWSAVMPGVPNLPVWRTINAAASVVLGLAAVTGLLLARRPEAAGVRLPLLAVVWFGASIAVAHGLYGVVARAAAVMAVAPGTAAPAWLLWDGLVFEPWFLIEGLLLAAGGRYLLNGAHARRAWTGACLAGVLTGLATALLEVRVL